MSEDVKRLIGNCFTTLEKIEVLGSLLYEKFIGDKEADVSLMMINSFANEAKLALVDLQNILKSHTA